MDQSERVKKLGVDGSHSLCESYLHRSIQLLLLRRLEHGLVSEFDQPSQRLIRDADVWEEGEKNYEKNLSTKSSSREPNQHNNTSIEQRNLQMCRIELINGLWYIHQKKMRET